MRTYSVIASKISPAQLISLTTFVRRRARRRPECAALVATLDAAYDPLLAAIGARDELAEERACATAELEYLDEVLDAAVANFVRHLLAHLGGDRGHATFKRMFPIAPSEATRDVASPEQSSFVGGVLKVFNDDKSLVGLTEHALTMQSALTALDTVRAERTALEQDEGLANAELAVRMDAMAAAYNGAFHQLSMIYPGQKGLVRSFFRDTRYDRTPPPAEGQS